MAIQLGYSRLAIGSLIKHHLTSRFARLTTLGHVGIAKLTLHVLTCTGDAPGAVEPLECMNGMEWNGDRYYCAGKSVLTHFVMKHHHYEAGKIRIGQNRLIVDRT